MAHLLAQARLQRNTGLPEDVIVNTFHFNTAGAAPVSVADAQNCATRITAFYTGIASMLSPIVGANQHEIRFYDQADVEPRTPILTTTFTVSVSGSPLPAEVALCLSYRAPLMSGDARGRFRGRIFIGPLKSTVVESGPGSAGDARPETSFRQNLLDVAKVMADAAGPVWSVYSPTRDAIQNQDGLSPISFLYVDNAFDTQRRRGAKPTSRLQTTAGGGGV